MINLFYIIFFLSGLSALIYQTVWMRIIGFFIGSSVEAASVAVGAFLLGLAFGGLFSSRFVNSKLLLLLYLKIEIMVSVYGYFSIDILKFFINESAANLNYVSVVGFLFIPATLMGMSFPILACILSELGARRVPKLYFLNTIGAACGVLLSTYVLVNLFGITVTVLFAALNNIFICLLLLVAFLIRKKEYARIK